VRSTGPCRLCSPALVALRRLVFLNAGYWWWDAWICLSSPLIKPPWSYNAARGALLRGFLTQRPSTSPKQTVHVANTQFSCHNWTGVFPLLCRSYSSSMPGIKVAFKKSLIEYDAVFVGSREQHCTLGSTYKAAHTAPFSRWSKVCTKQSHYPVVLTLRHAGSSDK
jgi:hypothetical protein